MFYEVKNGSGLPHNPFKAIVAPRPIGWISTLSAEGIPNLAPYSFFNAVADNPPQVVFSASSNHKFGGLKDAVGRRPVHRGVRRERGDLGLAGAHECLRRPCSARRGRVRVLRPYEGEKQAREVPASCGKPVAPGVPVHEVAGVAFRHPGQYKHARLRRGRRRHVDEKVLVDGQIDYLKVRPVGRLGYMDYVEVDNSFAMDRPDWP